MKPPFRYDSIQVGSECVKRFGASGKNKCTKRGCEAEAARPSRIYRESREMVEKTIGECKATGVEELTQEMDTVCKHHAAAKAAAIVTARQKVDDAYRSALEGIMKTVGQYQRELSAEGLEDFSNSLRAKFEEEVETQIAKAGQLAEEAVERQKKQIEAMHEARVARAVKEEEKRIEDLKPKPCVGCGDTNLFDDKKYCVRCYFIPCPMGELCRGSTKKTIIGMSKCSACRQSCQSTIEEMKACTKCKKMNVKKNSKFKTCFFCK